MHKLAARAVDLAFVILLAIVMVIPQEAFAQNHVISPSQLQRDIASASAVRQQDIREVETFLAVPGSREALASRHIDYRQVRDAVPELSNQELARLAQTSQDAQQRFTAGNITDRDMLWILIAVAVIILIVVAK
ncbi:MAG TPA: hypothetical protein VNK23_05370 [Candidatus Dormibacteraeota bacterium]|nr:hypothetical protein [Candidatus Dormibacteraeota bacterium]